MVIEIFLGKWMDITDKIYKSYSQRGLLSVEIPKTSTLSIKLDGDKAFIDSLAQEHEIRVTDQRKLRFEGFCNGAISINYINEDYWEASLKYYDFVKKIKGNNEALHFTNIQIAGSKGALLESLFNQVKLISNVDFTLVSSYIDVSVIDDIYIPEGDILTTFYDFLYHNGLAFYLVGKELHIYDLLNSPIKSWILDDVASLTENFKFGKEPSNPKVFASKVVSNSERIFTLSEDGANELLIDGDVYPVVEEIDDPSHLTCNYDILLNKNQELINVSDITVQQEVYDDTGNNVNLASDIIAGQESCDIKLTNSTGSYVILDNIFINATVNKQEYFQSSSFKANPVDEVKSVYLRDIEHVTRFLRYVVFLNGYDSKDYSFYADAEMSLGDMVSVVGLTEPLIIVQRLDKQDDFGGYNYKAVLYQNTIVDAITKKIAISKYQKDYLTEIYSNLGFVFDGDFSTNLTSHTFVGSQEIEPKTYKWYRDVGLVNDTWTRDTKSITINQYDLDGKASALFYCQTTYPNTTSTKKQVVNMAMNKSQFLIEYTTSYNSLVPNLINKGYFGEEAYQFGDEFIEVFESAEWTTVQPKDTDKYIFIKITDGNSQTISLYATPKEKSILLVADNSSIFSLTQRGVSRNETMSITLKAKNFFPIDGFTEWYFLSDDWIKLTETNATLTISHADFSYPLTIKAVYGELEDTIQISEIISSSPVLHLGVLEIIPTEMGLTIPVGFDEVGQEFIKGDSYVYHDNVDYIPYVFNGVWTTITDAEGNVEPKYADIMIRSANSITDINADIPNTSVAIYGYFRNLGAVNAFVDNLSAKNLEVGTTEKGFRFRAKTSENGVKLSTPIFDIMYNDTTVFKVDALSGDVTIGDYEKEAGAMWSQASKSFSIKGDGSFTGQLDTVTIQTVLGGDDTTVIGDIESAKTLIKVLTTYGKSHTDIKAHGTLNGENIISASYGTMRITEDRFYTHENYPSYYEYNSRFLLVNVSATVKTEKRTYEYMVRNIKTNAGWYFGGVFDPIVPPTPSMPTSVLEGLMWENFDVTFLPEPSKSNRNDPAKYYDEALFDSYGQARVYAGDIKDFEIYDTTKERLYIKALPHQLPNEPNRVWNDNGTLKIT